MGVLQWHQIKYYRHLVPLGLCQQLLQRQNVLPPGLGHLFFRKAPGCGEGMLLVEEREVVVSPAVVPRLNHALGLDGLLFIYWTLRADPASQYAQKVLLKSQDLCHNALPGLLLAFVQVQKAPLVKMSMETLFHLLLIQTFPANHYPQNPR